MQSFGLSPHVRGNRVADHVDRTPPGSIPACTGKPVRQPPSVLQPGVYPRMYGETYKFLSSSNIYVVYPRMYGETSRRTCAANILPGLSPHVRGNLQLRDRAGRVAGSIPACTGKPRSTARRPAELGVYPRMYGETGWQARSSPSPGGLSPHVRGNRRRTGCSADHGGSIPACTGKPRPRRRCSRPSEVYPRMYGETYRIAQCILGAWGLSPHVRGNPLRLHVGPLALGSIPACTGKPNRCLHHQAVAGVYPRMYGETTPCNTHLQTTTGLSPHVRGNRRRCQTCALFPRSIPACTGKPSSNAEHICRKGVYPRMYGETRDTEGST